MTRFHRARGDQKCAIDLIIRNGVVVTASDTFQADVGIEAGKVKQVGHGLGPAANEIDASRKYLIPSGVDVHTHVDLKLMGHLNVESRDDAADAVSRRCVGGPHLDEQAGRDLLC